jgi:hypothetical protein
MGRVSPVAMAYANLHLAVPLSCQARNSGKQTRLALAAPLLVTEAKAAGHDSHDHPRSHHIRQRPSRHKTGDALLRPETTEMMTDYCTQPKANKSPARG